MRLDRNLAGGVGKYAIVNLRRLDHMGPNERQEVDRALAFLAATGALEYGQPETAREFFVLKLSDRFAAAALYSYAAAAWIFDAEYARDILDVAHRAGPSSPFCKNPD